MTEIYYAAISELRHTPLMRKYATIFSPDFSDKLTRYRRWQDAQLSLLGRLLLKYGFEKNNVEYSDHKLFFTKHNKPIIQDHSLHFNISHSGEIAICILSDVADVGIDIEHIHQINLEDFRSQMTNLEWERVLHANCSERAFFDYWTQKEAVVKANGHGLSIPLKSFEVINDSSQINNDIFYVNQINLNDAYRCHIAFKNRSIESPPIPSEVKFAG